MPGSLLVKRTEAKKALQDADTSQEVSILLWNHPQALGFSNDHAGNVIIISPYRFIVLTVTEEYEALS